MRLPLWAAVLVACGRVAGGGDAETDAAVDAGAADSAADVDAADVAPRVWPCQGMQKKVCDYTGGCVWGYHCTGDGGSCSHGEPCTDGSCYPGERCFGVWGKTDPSSPCSQFFICVTCNPEAGYPYNCAEAGP